MTALLIFGSLTGAVALAVGLSLRAVRRWPGVWQALAWLPVVMIVTHAGLIVFETRSDPASHRLWPVELLVVSGGALLLLGILAGARRLLTGGRSVP